MSRFIILFFVAAMLLNFAIMPDSPSVIEEELISKKDTVPIKVTEALIQELMGDAAEKTWRDSGYYFQLEPVLWEVKKLRNMQNGDVLALTSFSSADPSSLIFNGQAVFRFDRAKWPAEFNLAKGMKGEALIAFPQDVLLCPSPTQEIGLGQNDPNFPLYLSGTITGVDAGNTFTYFELSVSVQLRDIDIIL